MALRTDRRGGCALVIHPSSQYVKQRKMVEEIQSIEVPICLFEGRYDWTHPTIPVEHFYENLENKDSVHLLIFENSAHFPMIEEEEKY